LADSEAVIARLLAEAETTPHRAERVDRLRRAAHIYESELGDPGKAFAVWQAVFATDLSDGSGQSLERLADRLGWGSALISEFRPLVAEATNPRERALLLAWLGRWLARFADDFSSAEEYLIEAVRLDPACQMATRTLRALGSHLGKAADIGATPPATLEPSAPVPLPRLEALDSEANTHQVLQSQPLASLHTKLDALVAAGRWAEAVEVLAVLARTADPPMRARYLATGGKILHHKLGQHDAAVQMFNQALDVAPTELPVFERIYQILSGRQAWPQAESNLVRMIARIQAAQLPDKGPTLEALWRRLGDVYRLGLKDLAAAANAYERCARLAPHSTFYPKVLADLAGRMSRPRN
jgi:hypothetical protein